MKKLPKYLLKKVDHAIEKAKETDEYWNDWEIYVEHWGSPNNHLSYFGKSLDDALEEIPSTYSHTDNSGADLVVLQIKKQHVDEHGDIHDTDWIYELEMTK